MGIKIERRKKTIFVSHTNEHPLYVPLTVKDVLGVYSYDLLLLLYNHGLVAQTMLRKHGGKYVLSKICDCSR